MVLCVTVIAVILFLVERRVVSRSIVAALAVPVVLAAQFTGNLLPWEQLALTSVVLGADVTGFDPLLGDDVRFVLVDGRQVSPGTVLRWLAVHVTLGACLLGAMVWLTRHRREPSRRG